MGRACILYRTPRLPWYAGLFFGAFAKACMLTNELLPPSLNQRYVSEIVMFRG